MTETQSYMRGAVGGGLTIAYSLLVMAAFPAFLVAGLNPLYQWLVAALYGAGLLHIAQASWRNWQYGRPMWLFCVAYAAVFFVVLPLTFFRLWAVGEGLGFLWGIMFAGWLGLVVWTFARRRGWRVRLEKFETVRMSCPDCGTRLAGRVDVLKPVSITCSECGFGEEDVDLREVRGG